MEIYAIHEFTVKAVVRVAIAEIVARGHTYANLRTSLLAIFLDPELRSIRDCGLKKNWEARLKLLDKANANLAIGDMPSIPDNGTHYRYEQVELILQVFGIKSMRFFERRRHRINEIVTHRHEIAHGAATASNVGRRFSRTEMRDKINQSERICLRLVNVMSKYCSDPARHRK